MAEARANPAPAERLGYEPSDVNVKAVLGVALILLVVVGLFAAALGGLLGLFRVGTGAPPASPLARVEIAPPPPRLDAHPEQTLAQVREGETAALEGYGWVDRDAGIARIPIEQAMRLMARRGWPSNAEPSQPGGASR